MGLFYEPTEGSAVAGEARRARWVRTRQAKDRTTIPVAHSTIVGPVGTLRPGLLRVSLRTDPPAPAAAPNSPANTVITPNRSVHCRAAAAGATTSALIS